MEERCCCGEGPQWSLDALEEEEEEERKILRNSNIA